MILTGSPNLPDCCLFCSKVNWSDRNWKYPCHTGVWRSWDNPKLYQKSLSQYYPSSYKADLNVENSLFVSMLRHLILLYTNKMLGCPQNSAVFHNGLVARTATFSPASEAPFLSPAFCRAGGSPGRVWCFSCCRHHRILHPVRLPAIWCGDHRPFRN